MASRTTISSLALLKARFDSQHADFLDTLRPFVASVIVRHGLENFVPLDAQRHILSDFGLAIPRHTVELVLRRLTRDQQINRVDHKYQRASLQFDVAAFDAARTDAVRYQNATLAGLIEYARTHMRIDLSDEQAESALDSYIDQYSVECIRAYAHASIVPTHGRSPEHWHFMVSSYVNAISKSDPQRFSYLLSVVMGRMLANALLGEDLTDIGMKFRDTTAYLDTPVALQLLGALGEAGQLLAEEMLVLLKRANARTAIFDHDIHEVEQVLRYAEEHLHSGRPGTGNVLTAMRDLGYSASDAAMLRASVSTLLAEKGVEAVEAPPYIGRFQIDEIALEKEIEGAGLKYRNDGAKRIDINSIRSIYVLREGKSPTRIETCSAIFVTNNSALARASFSYGRHHEESRAISTVITDFSLTNLLWLKAPMEYVDVPRKMIAADCLAALRPTEAFWATFLRQIDGLEKSNKVTAAQHQVLRYELRVREELMNLTLGDESQLTDAQILSALEHHEQEITRPLRETVSALESRVAETTSERDKANAILSRVESRVSRVSHAIAVSIKVACIAIAFVLLAVSHGLAGKDFAESLTRPWREITLVLTLITEVFVILHVFSHKVSIWNPVSRFSAIVEKRLQRIARTVLGLGE